MGTGKRRCPECRQMVTTRDNRRDGLRYYAWHRDENQRECPMSGKRSHKGP